MKMKKWRYLSIWNDDYRIHCWAKVHDHLTGAISSLQECDNLNTKEFKYGTDIAQNRRSQNSSYHSSEENKNCWWMSWHRPDLRIHLREFVPTKITENQRLCVNLTKHYMLLSYYEENYRTSFWYRFWSCSASISSGAGAFDLITSKCECWNMLIPGLSSILKLTINI